MYDRNISLDANLYFFFLVEWAKIYTIEEGVWNILNIFRFLFLSNFTDKLYVTFEKKGGGTAFQNLFFGINMRIESTYEYGGTSPPLPRLRFYVLFSRMNKEKYILCMWTFSRDDAFIHRNVCPTSRKPGRRSVTCRLQHSVSNPGTCTWIIHLWTCQLCIWVTV